MKIILCIIPFHIIVTSCYSKDKAVMKLLKFCMPLVVTIDIIEVTSSITRFITVVVTLTATMHNKK